MMHLWVLHMACGKLCQRRKISKRRRCCHIKRTKISIWEPGWQEPSMACLHRYIWTKACFIKWLGNVTHTLAWFQFNTSRKLTVWSIKRWHSEVTISVYHHDLFTLWPKCSQYNKALLNLLETCWKCHNAGFGFEYQHLLSEALRTHTYFVSLRVKHFSFSCSLVWCWLNLHFRALVTH